MAKRGAWHLHIRVGRDCHMQVTKALQQGAAMLADGHFDEQTTACFVEKAI